MYDNLFTIEIGTHFFKINHPTARALPIIFKFATYYTITEFTSRFKKNPPYKLVKVFASRVYDNTEFRFHIGQYESFIEHLHKNYITPDLYIIIYKGLYEPAKIDINLQPQWILRDYQITARDFLLSTDQNDNKSRLLTLNTGLGKAQPLDSFIKIPDGWTTMGNIKLDDTIVVPDGSYAKVNGVFPQGMKDIYTITFKDGRSAECCEDHLWRVYSPNFKEKWRIIDTKELIKIGHLANNYHIQTPKPHDCKDLDLLIDPYTIGSLLGTRNIFLRLLKESNVNEKTIPELYLNGSIQQRLELLQGILDTDSVIGTNGSITFCSTNLDLATGVQYLVRSLGGISSISYKKLIYTYEVSIKVKKQSDLFRVDVNKLKTKDINLYNPEDLTLGIHSIKYVGQKEAQCISVDHPDHLYITNDFVVTHNTVIALAASSVLKTRTSIIVLPTFAEKWVSDRTGIVYVDPKEVLLVQGSKQLKKLIGVAQNYELDYKFIIISLRTIQSFYKAYEKYKDFIEEEEGYECLPEDLCEVLKIGSIIIDESHLNLHAVYKLLSYTNVPKVMALTATMLSNDSRIDRIQKFMFPKEIRFDGIKPAKYIKVYAIAYRFDNIQASRIRTNEYGSTVYSHTAFEKSIMRDYKTMVGYMRLIDYIVNIGYIEKYIQGDKLAIYVASVSLCNELTKYLKAKHPQIDIRRYVEQDPYENVIDADIRITTILSAGTAIDIPNLRAIIMTNNVLSPISNIQTLGRLRKLKDRDVKFYYLYCEQIPKHQQFHKKRMELFSDRVLTHKELFSNITV